MKITGILLTLLLGKCSALGEKELAGRITVVKDIIKLSQFRRCRIHWYLYLYDLTLSFYTIIIIIIIILVIIFINIIAIMIYINSICDHLIIIYLGPLYE